jgi:hypothetical protein
MNNCSLFPDRLNLGWIMYDISGVCAVHDFLYESGECTRAEADKWMLNTLIDVYPQYLPLWIIVYMALRQFGWIAWYAHRIKMGRTWATQYMTAKIHQSIEGSKAWSEIMSISAA